MAAQRVMKAARKRPSQNRPKNKSNKGNNYSQQCEGQMQIATDSRAKGSKRDTERERKREGDTGEEGGVGGVSIYN